MNRSILLTLTLLTGCHAVSHRLGTEGCGQDHPGPIDNAGQIS